MKRRLSMAYAGLNTVGLLLGYAAVFYFAWSAGMTQLLLSLIGFFLGVVFAPILHELGHLIFAAAHGLKYVYFKAFCFRFVRVSGRVRFSIVSPFGADETQVIPTCGGNMRKRAASYAVGGLLVEGIVALLLFGAALIFSILASVPFLIWGTSVYFLYLLLLNVVSADYASGKTDMSIYLGIIKELPPEQNMLAAMEIQGQLYEGKSFAEIPEQYYFKQPQLCEDEPLFAVMLDLQYRYWLEKGDFDHAAACLNRLAQIEPYLSGTDTEKLLAELTYMHSLNGDKELASECKSLCENYLGTNSLTACRVKAAYAQLIQDESMRDGALETARRLLRSEDILGNAKFEEILLSRISAE